MFANRKGRAAVKRRAALLLPTVLMSACALLAGCYSLVPVDVSSVRPPERVRADLAPSAAVRVGEVLGAPKRVLDGELVERTQEGFYLLVPTSQIQQPGGMGVQMLHQRLFIPEAELLGLQRRELDWVRTSGLAVASVGFVGTLMAFMLSGNSGGSTGAPPEGGPAQVRIPFFSSSIP